MSGALVVASATLSGIGPEALLLEGVGEFVTGRWDREIESVVATARGPVGLAVVALYSFLIAFVLPLPSEVVLAPAGHMHLGLSVPVNYALVILVSAIGKTVGSLFAFHLGQEAKQAGPVVRTLRRSRFDVVGWSQRRLVQLSKRYGYVGLALALSVPGFPDTLSIYAFAVLEEDYAKFALATFVGSVGRLLVFVGVVGGTIAVV